jgi:hypothetical protein
MTKFSKEQLQEILDEKNDQFEIEHTEFSDSVQCGSFCASFKDKETGKYYNFHYYQIDDFCILAPDAEAKEAKRMTEVEEIVRNGNVVNRTESVWFEEIEEEDTPGFPKTTYSED